MLAGLPDYVFVFECYSGCPAHNRPGNGKVIALCNELKKPEYAELSDQKAADAINQKTEVIEHFVPIHDLKQFAILNGIWPKLKLGQRSSDAQTASVCTSVIDWVDDLRTLSVDLALPEVQQMIAVLVGSEILTQQQADAIVAMGTKVIPWTQSVGLPEVGIGLVINARKAIAAD